MGGTYREGGKSDFLIYKIYIGGRVNGKPSYRRI
ncbi:hypothetical protein EV203_10110 [Caldanaerobacter subterraneus]|uniref:Uncharacterized protein n=1 Tax=Caldanaerobacter subterraneus TaxID=911092 RepID=A0A4R2K5M2_9THEO|nr:hypothetical protein EV203_10110 [Caldanaerobacter subterraneus]